MVTPSWPPPALSPAVPANGTRPIQLFAVGDSWAQQAGNDVGVFSQVLAPPLGPFHLVAGTGALGASFRNALDASGAHRFTVSQVQSWGIGGSTAAGWSTGRPCEPYRLLDGDQIASNDRITDMYTLGCMHLPRSTPTPDLMTPLLTEIRNSPQQPVVYLSLGGNDLIFVLSGIIDVRGDSGALPADFALTTIQTSIEAVVSQILAVRPDADIILPGYAHLNTSQPWGPGTTALTGFWQPLYRYTPAITAAETDALLNGATSGPLTQPGAGLRTVYSAVQAAHPGQVFAVRSENFGETIGFIADNSRWADMIHLNSSNDAYPRYTDGVAYTYRP